MLSLWDVLGVPSTRVSVTVANLTVYIIPPIACYFIVAALAVAPKTHIIRVALWPVVGLLAWRAVFSVDMSLGNPGQKAFNTSLVFYMFMIVIRTFDWTLEQEPLLRLLRPANSTPSTFMDVLDLATNIRGHGWNWSRGVYIPCETRPTNRFAFAFYAFLSAIVHGFVWGVSHRAVLSFTFADIGFIPEVPTIVDYTLPFLVRYLRAGIIAALAAVSGYASLQMGYDLYSIAGILIFGQDPAQWPPAFEAPWWATSLHDFWGRRWHQWNRRVLLTLGGYPLSLILGRAGLVLGTFLASAVMHDIVLLSLDSRIEFRWMLVGFGMMGPGMLAERAFYRLTGRRVGGAVGWVWTMVWLLSFGGVMAEGCARAGGLGDASLIDDMTPVRVLVERLVASFDNWLHTI